MAGLLQLKPTLVWLLC